MWVADRSSFSNPGNGMECKARNRRLGADLPKNESGRTGTCDKSSHDRYRIASSGNGTCIAVQSFSSCDFEIEWQSRLILHMRSLCSSTAMTLFSDVSETSP